MSGAALGITDKIEAWPQPPSSSRRHGPRMKGLALVILTCFFLSLVELAGKNVKVLIVFERSMSLARIQYGGKQSGDIQGAAWSFAAVHTQCVYSLVCWVYNCSLLPRHSSPQPTSSCQGQHPHLPSPSVKCEKFRII